jgi:hypothetical protein
MGHYTTGRTTQKRDKVISEKQSEISKLKAESSYWKSMHDNQVKLNRLLRDRPDLPVERVTAYEYTKHLFLENQMLRDEIKKLKGEK